MESRLTTITIVKRDGKSEPLDIEKIHRCVEWACDGLTGVSVSEIELSAKIYLRDGITTQEIQNCLIKAAAELISPDAEDYKFAAARLLMQQLSKEVTGSGIEYPHLCEYIEMAVAEQVLDERMLTHYGQAGLDELNAHLDYSRDLQFDYLGLQTLVDRYFVRSRPQSRREKGAVIELPQHFWMRVAMGLALNEERAKAVAWAKEFYDVLSKFEFVNSTPTLFNSGTLHSQMSSCYLNYVPDSIGGIYETISECAHLSKWAGGIGTGWTAVRGAGSYIHGTGGQSSGVVPYLKVWNDTAVAVNQCFAPGTMMLAKHGIVPIEELCSGDLLPNIEGQYKPVKEARGYDQDGNVVRLKTCRSIEPVTVTAGHPFAVIRNVPKRTGMSRVNWGGKEVEWVEAGDLKETDMIVYSVPESSPATALSPDDARMVGIMLGDGHARNGDRNEAGVSLGIKGKAKTIEFVRDYLNSKGVNFREYTDVNCLYINWRASDLPMVDRSHLYDEAGAKVIHCDYLHLPKGHTQQLVIGLAETDGNKKGESTLEYSTTSRKLAYGLRFVLMRLGVLATGYRRKISSATFTCRNGSKVTSKNCKDVFCVSIPAVEPFARWFGLAAHKSHQGWYVTPNGHLLDRVKSVEGVKYSGRVHDFLMDGQPSYMTSVGIAHNGGKRKGAFAAYLEPWHNDAMAFMDLKKQTGDHRLRAHDIYTAWWIPDLFMQRVKKSQVTGEPVKWSFFDSGEYPELNELYGAAFDARYKELEVAGKAVKQVDVMEFWKEMLGSIFKTGGPWITFKDECNSRSPQDHVGVIHSSNLCCIAGDQRVVTDIGMLTVKQLFDGGYAPKLSGRGQIVQGTAMELPRPNAPIMEVRTKEGYSHRVTPDHRIYVQDRGWVEAQDLSAGDKIELQHVSQHGSEDNHKLAFLAGVVAADGTFQGDSACIDLWEGKTSSQAERIEFLAASAIADASLDLATLSESGRIASVEAVSTPKFVLSADGKKARMTSSAIGRLLRDEGLTKETKLDVPDFVWCGSENVQAAYLQGLFICDGTTQASGDTCVASLSSTSRKFLADVQLLLLNNGIKSSLTKMRDAGERELPDGKGGSANYNCNAMFRLMVTSRAGCAKLERLTGIGDQRGNEVYLAKLRQRHYEQKMTATVTELVPQESEDAYCLRVDSDDHAWTVNGVVTHNTEITLNTSTEETAVCNLGSINAARVSRGDIPNIVSTAIRMLDNVIDLNFYPSENSRRANMRHRPIGLGVMGWAECMAKEGVSIDSQEHLDRTFRYFEALSYSAIFASTMLAEERGAYESFEGSKWSKGILPIHTANQLALSLVKGGFQSQVWNWDWLADRVKRVGMRNSNVMAIAPTATIANITGTTPCIEPPYMREFTKENLSGTFSVIDPTIKYGAFKSAMNIDQEWIIKAAAVRQIFIDQSQSTNLWAKRGTRGRDISEWYQLAWQLGLKTTYYLKNQVDEVKEAPVRSEEEEPVMCSIDNPDCESCQ